MHPLVAAAAPALLPAGGRVVAPSEGVARALAGSGWAARASRTADLADGSVDVLALLDDELSHAGEHAEGLVAEAARVLRPGGVLAVSVRAGLWARARDEMPSVTRAFTAAELDRALGHAGFTVEATYAPGAAARLVGAGPASAGGFDPTLDRSPGLLDAAERIVARARRHHDGAERSRAFFASLPRKVVAAGVVCRDASGRLLIVHDTFKDHWTIPGGVVDADEDPREGALRETWEETGVHVEVGALVGVFVASWPDRLVLVFEARSLVQPPPEPAPVHAHEIGSAAWMPLDLAVARLAPHVAAQVRRSLASPGGVWRADGL